MINLHNHTIYSDGAFAPETIVLAAIEAGLTHVGISDHFKTAKLGPRAQYIALEELSDYIRHIRALAARYAPQISVLAGLEIDFSERTPLDQLWLRGFSRTPLNDLDYVLFEYVGDPEWKGLPLTALFSYRRWIRVPVGLAHSFWARSFASLMPADELARALEKHEIFLELCTSEYHGLESPLTDERVPYYRYPDPYHEALLESFKCFDTKQGGQVLFSIGSDTHNAIAEVAAVNDAWAFLQENGLANRLVTQRYWPRQGHHR